MSRIEGKIATIPQQLEENDRKLEDLIAKIINIESNSCNYESLVNGDKASRTEANNPKK